jgi:hypothetical protein
MVALDECEKMLTLEPDFQPLQSIKMQLQYLLGILMGEIHDRSRLNEIIIGIYAAREFETRDMAFANVLYGIDKIVEEMKDDDLL